MTKFAKVDLMYEGQSQGSYIGPIEVVVEEIKAWEGGEEESFLITFVDMTEEELEKLPEFEGW